MIKPMVVTPIKTHKITPQDSVLTLLDTYLPPLAENSIIAIASKIISICEHRLIPKHPPKNKRAIIQQEADYCFPSPVKHPNFSLTLKDHRLIPNAGVDESNCANYYVLLPLAPQVIAKKIWQYVRKKHQLKHLGIIITDSTITPLRAGVTGIAIGWCGFKPLYSYIGKKDIFGQPLQVTQINLIDSLATTATLMMGEGNEQTPIAIIRNPPVKIIFQPKAPSKKEEQSVYMAPHKDLFSTVIAYD